MHKNLFIPIFLVSAIFLSGCGKKKNISKIEEMPPKPVSRQKTEIEEKPAENPPQVIHYTVKLSGKTLTLYEIDGEMQKTVTAIEINPDFYPAEDIKNLEKGISVNCKEDGYEILENFAN